MCGYCCGGTPVEKRGEAHKGCAETCHNGPRKAARQSDPDATEREHRSAALRDFANFQFGRFGSGHQIEMLRLWAEKEARGERIPAEPPTVTTGEWTEVGE